MFKVEVNALSTVARRVRAVAVIAASLAAGHILHAEHFGKETPASVASAPAPGPATISATPTRPTTVTLEAKAAVPAGSLSFESISFTNSKATQPSISQAVLSPSNLGSLHLLDLNPAAIYWNASHHAASGVAASRSLSDSLSAL